MTWKLLGLDALSKSRRQSRGWVLDASRRVCIGSWILCNHSRADPGMSDLAEGFGDIDASLLQESVRCPDYAQSGWAVSTSWSRS